MAVGWTPPPCDPPEGLSPIGTLRWIVAWDHEHAGIGGVVPTSMLAEPSLPDPAYTYDEAPPLPQDEAEPVLDICAD